MTVQMSVAAIVRELVAKGESHKATRGVFAIINRILNDHGYRAAVTNIRAGVVEFNIEAEPQ